MDVSDRVPQGDRVAIEFKCDRAVTLIRSKRVNRIAGLGLAVVACLLWLLVAGCESDSTSATSDVSGSWLFSDTFGQQSTWALVQDADGAIAGAGTTGESIRGAVSGDFIYMTLTYSSSNLTASLSGEITGSTMSGTVTNSILGIGSWTAAKTN